MTRQFNNFIVGLTGGIGSGKTAASDHFASLGIQVVDADIISHSITAKGSDTLNALCQAFGTWILTPTGELDRQALRHYVFSSPKALATLNAITHPAIRQRLIADLTVATSPYVILSAPLLLESIKGNDKGLTAFCDRILVIDVPIDLQRQRASTRDTQSIDTINAIIDKQLNRSARLSLGDDIVDNSQDLPYLYAQLDSLHQTYLNLAAIKATQQGDTYV